MKFRTIEASPMEVYEAHVDLKKQAAFTGEGAAGSPRVGGKFTASGRYFGEGWFR